MAELSCSPEDLSYSAFLEQIHTSTERSESGTCDDGFRHVRPRHIHAWVPDDAVTHCKQCKLPFSFFRRKHHCRACGRIFCYVCSAKTMVLPRDLESFPRSPESSEWVRYLSTWTGPWWGASSATPERVCDSCERKLTQISHLGTFIQILDHLALDIQGLALMAQLSQQWRRAANVMRSLYRDIQYKLPSHVFAEREEALLLRNRCFFGGHSRWLVQLLKVTRWNDPIETQAAIEALHAPKTVRCWSLMCGRFCREQITVEEALELLHYRIPNVQVRRFLVNCIGRASDETFECVVPLLTYDLAHELAGDESMLELLVRRSVENANIRTVIYWSLIVLRERQPSYRYFYNQFVARLDRRMGKEVVWNQLVRGRKVVKIFESMPNPAYASETEIKQYFRSKLHEGSCFFAPATGDTAELLSDSDIARPTIPLPIRPGTYAYAVDVESIKVKQSATSPVIVPFLCSQEPGGPSRSCSEELPDTLAEELAADVGDGEEDRREVMYKRECLIKDQIAVNIVRLMDQILKREEGLDLHILTYRVLPTSHNAGLIEIIPNSETIYAIRQKMHFSIQNYILEHNGHLTGDEVRDNFVKSTAAYCVISYLLAVGDRHLDNIMVTEDGRLFHIDYGFIMGFDPKPLAPYMRITQDIIDAMGGENSAHYVQFKEYCTRAYNCLRGYTNLFTNLLTLLTEDGLAIDDGQFTRDRLEQEITHRFVPGESYVEAELQLFTRIEGSCHSYTPQFFIDFWHYHCRRDSGFGSAMHHLTEVPSSLSRSLANIWPFGKGSRE